MQAFTGNRHPQGAVCIFFAMRFIVDCFFSKGERVLSDNKNGGIGLSFSAVPCALIGVMPFHVY